MGGARTALGGGKIGAWKGQIGAERCWKGPGGVGLWLYRVGGQMGAERGQRGTGTGQEG